MSEPADGASYPAGTTIDLAATTTGTVGRVRFKQNGTYIGTGDFSAPYTGTFTPTTAGTYVLTADAYYNLNVVATSAPITIIVTSGGGGSNGAPNVSLTSPSDGATAIAPGSFILTATASDSDGSIASVRFFSGTSLMATDATAPYSYTVSGLAEGAYAFTAVAVDNDGAYTVSDTVNVTVTAAPTPTPVSLTRTYVYDANERLCKIIEPETGATVIDYDGAGNVAWRAEGQDLPDTNACNRILVPESAKTKYACDELNRVTKVTTPDGYGTTVTSYTPDGLPATATVWNDAGANDGTTAVSNTFTYNHRRLLTAETQTLNAITWSASYGYDASAHVTTVTYPQGVGTVTSTLNALGQATGVTGYANGAAYYANGALAGFNYANGIVHSLTQNARGLPLQSRDKNGSATIAGLEATYDANGNVTTLMDLTDSADYAASGRVAGYTDRGMIYDGLDRLTHVDELKVDGGTADYTYDALDNLRHATQGTAGFTYSYDAHNRLALLARDSGGSYVYTSDAAGNTTSDGVNAYTFDASHRLRHVQGAGGATGSSANTDYLYDAAGRRVRSIDTDGKVVRSFYSQAGVLLYDENARNHRNTAYVYLSGDPLAEVRKDTATHTTATWYVHTDLLGSPVAWTDPAKAVHDRTDYAPYGLPLTGAMEGVSYTGHVMDQASGLIYAQQRYYDPRVGRFLSVDPVIANFNRFSYANNNPYFFKDPDGRNGVTALGGLITEGWNAANGRGFDGDMVMSALADGYDGEGDGFARSAVDDALAFVPLAKVFQAAKLGNRLFEGYRAASKMENVRQLGRAGEAAAGIVKNTTRIPSASGTAAYRIPDGLTPKVLTEVKNYSGTLRLTSQLKDFLSYAKDTKRTFELVVGKDAKLAKPLQALVDAGEIVLKRLE